MERDSYNIVDYGIIFISTHTLTWSVTAEISAVKLTDKISTHTLTWSVTFFATSSVRTSSISTHTLTWSVTQP